MNMIEKILARSSGRDRVAPGEVVVANVDLMVMHDLSANFVTRVFREELGGGAIHDPSRIAFVFDHNFSSPTEEGAERLHRVRRFAAEHGIRVFDGGSGSLHHVIIESGLWAPGQIVIGCDSHTPIHGALGLFATGVGNNSMAALGFRHSKAWFRIPQTVQVRLEGTPPDGVQPRDVAAQVVGFMGEDSAIYQALEYAGGYIEGLSIEDRCLFPLMSIDLGAKAAFIDPDDKTVAYAKEHSSAADFEVITNDPGTRYASVVRVDVAAIDGPRVACPPTVGNVKTGKRGRRHRDRSCRGRWKHGRTPDRHSNTGGTPPGQAGPSWGPPPSGPGQQKYLQGSHPGGVDRNAAGCRRHRLPAERGFEPGRQYGCDVRGRGHDIQSGP